MLQSSSKHDLVHTEGRRIVAFLVHTQRGLTFQGRSLSENDMLFAMRILYDMFCKQKTDREYQCQALSFHVSESFISLISTTSEIRNSFGNETHTTVYTKSITSSESLSQTVVTLCQYRKNNIGIHIIRMNRGLEKPGSAQVEHLIWYLFIS